VNAQRDFSESSCLLSYCVVCGILMMNFAQIQDYVQAVKALHRPLWVYIWVNSDIDPVCSDLVESTSGGTVWYFTMPGYRDPTDRAAQTGLAYVSPYSLETC
jgi:hypothetical protein